MTPHLNANEKIVWQCTPSQWNNAGTFLLCGLFFWTVIQRVCCTGCNREVFQLTESGRVFARRIDGLEVPGCVAKAQQVEATVPKLGDWFFRHLPKVWGRWWSARLLATSTCAVWLHSENPEFTNWQRHKRNALCLALFLVPVRLPIAIHAETKSVHFRG